MAPFEQRIHGYDLRGLEGRKIVIDPGHGGPFGGAIGPRGLREADVNLGVALHLSELLQAAGARVRLTRSSDVAVVNKENPTLEEDLRERSAISEEFAPEAFLSIHHNADIVPNSQKNAIETYYNLSDWDGPSFDMAKAVHSHIKAHLGIEPAKLVPGNFFVLRSNKALASILCELSYITHKKQEALLRDSSYQRLEAEALFFGLLDYFSAGVPRASDLMVSADNQAEAPSLFSGKLIEDMGVPIDPHSISFLLDGEPLPFFFDPRRGLVKASPSLPLTNGIHSLSLRATNIRGNSSPRARHSFSISRPVRHLFLEAQSEALPADGGTRTILTAHLLDEHLLPVSDGTEVHFTTTAGKIIKPLARTVKGRATSYLVAPERPSVARVKADASTVSDSREVNFLAASSFSEVVLSVSVVDGNTQEPVEGASVHRGNHLSLLTTNEDGFVSLLMPKGHGNPLPIHIQRAGYMPFMGEIHTSASTFIQFQLRPIAEGLLMGKSFILDAQKGSETSQKVVHYLTQLLRQSGARVHQIDQGFMPVSDEGKAQLTNEAPSEAFLSIGHGLLDEKRGTLLNQRGWLLEQEVGPGPHVAYYYKSIRGHALAQKAAQYLSPLSSPRSSRALPSSDYLLTHTACPAIMVLTDRDETISKSHAHARQEAYAIFNGLLEYMGIKEEETGSLRGEVIEGRSQKPVENALIVVDGALSLLSDQDGQFHFSLLSAGAHHLTIKKEGYELSEATFFIKEAHEAFLKVTLSFGP